MILSRQLVSRGQVAMSWVGSGCLGNAVNGMGCLASASKKRQGLSTKPGSESPDIIAEVEEFIVFPMILMNIYPCKSTVEHSIYYATPIACH